MFNTNMSELSEAGELTVMLGALQLGDSFFPSGRFSLSHGLETFAQSGLVRSAGDLELVMADYLTQVVARSEAVAVATANRAASAGDLVTIIEVDQLLFAMKLPAEASASSTRTGRQLLSTLRQLVTEPAFCEYGRCIEERASPGNHAVVFGVAAAAWGLSPVEAALVELYAYATNLLGAGLRTVRMDHVQSQAILDRLKPTMIASAEMAARLDYHDMSAFAPMIEMMQLRHERSHIRLFAS